MGNPCIWYPDDEPTPCWTCAQFVGLTTAWRGYLALGVTCAERGRYCGANPQVGCRRYVVDPERSLELAGLAKSDSGTSP